MMNLIRTVLALVLSAAVIAAQAAPQTVYRMTGVANFTKGAGDKELPFPVNPVTASTLTFDGNTFTYHESGHSCAMTVNKTLPYQFDMIMVHAFGTPEKFNAFLNDKFHVSSTSLAHTYYLGQENAPLCSGLRWTFIYQSPEQLLVVMSARIYLFERQTQAPSDAELGFDCGKARSKVEHLICNDPALVKLDATVNRGYVAMRMLKSPEISYQDPVRLNQIEWIRKVRNACDDQACLLKAYNGRVQYIKGQLGDNDPDYPNESTQDGD
ncbi:lysozyme inhibitor LprI family protein [Burkholderia sp. 22PA0106]|uniref:lysozyme inhibitor LprI family protein n=1 Tax=Burkholderia sp. 22PA0106 TaxID=3237371 RepID=UPI0039C248C7